MAGGAGRVSGSARVLFLRGTSRTRPGSSVIPKWNSLFCLVSMQATVNTCQLRGS